MHLYNFKVLEGGRGSRGRGKEAVSCLGKSLCKMRLSVRVNGNTVEYFDGGYIIATGSVQVKAKGQGCLIQRNSKRPGYAGTGASQLGHGTRRRG